MIDMSELPDAIEESDLPSVLAEVIKRAEDGRALLVTRGGKRVAAFVSVLDYELAERAIDEAWARRPRPYDDGTRISLEEVEAELFAETDDETSEDEEPDLPDSIEESDLLAVLTRAIIGAEDGGAIPITRDGNPVAALVSMTDHEVIERLIDEARRSYPRGDGLDVTLDEIKADLLQQDEAWPANYLRPTPS